MVLGELARRFALSADLVTAAIAPRVGSVIRGRLDGGLLYTAAYIARIKAQVCHSMRYVRYMRM